MRTGAQPGRQRRFWHDGRAGVNPERAVSFRSAVAHRDALVHVARRFGTAALADNAGRNAGNRLAGRDGFEHDRAGSHLGTRADLDIAEDLGACADEHAAPDLGMTVAVFLARAAQRHTLENGDVVLDDGGRADDKTRGMVEEYALADARGRIDVGLEHRRRAALQVEREILPSLLPQPVRQPVGLDCVKPLEIEHRFHEAGAGRVAVIDGLDVDPEDIEFVLPALSFTPPLGRAPRNKMEEIQETSNTILNKIWTRRTRLTWKKCQQQVILRVKKRLAKYDKDRDENSDMDDSEILLDNKLYEFIGKSSRKISYKTQKL